MKTLSKKIKDSINNKDDNYIYLTGNEFLALVKMQRVRYFNLTAGADRYISDGSSEYYPAIAGSIKITRGQATSIAYDFNKYSSKDGKDLFAKVFLSEWDNKQLYISL